MYNEIIQTNVTIVFHTSGRNKIRFICILEL